MEDHWLWYISGSIDTAGRFTVMFRQDDEAKLGYTIDPAITYNRPKEVESIFGMLDEYCEEQNVAYRIDDQKSSNRFTVTKPYSIRNFLEPIISGFVQQRERAEFMLDEFLPMVEGDGPQTKEEFIEAVEVADELREMPITGYSSKYDAEYFKEEWSDELSE